MTTSNPWDALAGCIEAANNLRRTLRTLRTMDTKHTFPPGLGVDVVVRDERGQIVRAFCVDYTTHAGRGKIADTAQAAMIAGHSVTTTPVRAPDPDKGES